MKYACRECGYQGEFPTQPKGSLILEMALWFLALITFFTLITPMMAVWYSIFRLDPASATCPKCGWVKVFPYYSVSDPG